MSRSWSSVSAHARGWPPPVSQVDGVCQSGWSGHLSGVLADQTQSGTRRGWGTTSIIDTDLDETTPASNNASPDGVAEQEEDPMVRRRRAEAVLLLSKGPLSPRKLAQMAGLNDATESRTMIRDLNETYLLLGRAIRVELIAGGYRMMTRAALAPWISRLSHVPKPVRLSTPMMETLAIVAYRGPVSRAAVEAVRGVACGELLRQLMERDLARIAGRSEELGRPYLYDTTKRFLQLFGLPNTEALPKIHWQSLHDDSPESTHSDSTHPIEPSTTTKEPVVTNTLVSASTEIDPTVLATSTCTDTAIDTTNLAKPSDPTAVIEDEEDDLYEGVDLDDADEEDDKKEDGWDEDDWDDDEADDDELEDNESDDDELNDDESDDDNDDDLEEDNWEEVDDSDEDSDEESEEESEEDWDSDEEEDEDWDDGEDDDEKEDDEADENNDDKNWG